MKKINIKGNPYVMVNERLKEFRTNEAYKGWSLISDIVNLTDDICVIKASAIDNNGVVRATGLAQEDRASTMINKTSFVENCETSAWGGALGNLGIGIDESVASADEVDMAIKQQELIDNLELECSDCGKEISEKVAKYSLAKFGRELCYDCQKQDKLGEVEV